MKLHEIKIGAEKAGNDDDRGAVPARNAKAVVHGRRVQNEDLSPEKCFCPKRGVGFRMRPGSTSCAASSWKDALLLFSLYAANSSRVSPIPASRRAEANAALQYYTACLACPKIFLHDVDGRSGVSDSSALCAGATRSAPWFLQSGLEFRHSLAQRLNFRLRIAWLRRR